MEIQIEQGDHVVQERPKLTLTMSSWHVSAQMSRQAIPEATKVRASPKRSNAQGSEWYPYYAGYSAEFVREALDRLALPAGAVVMDPWNGAGTTTATAASLGFRAVGIDINPAMALVASGRMLPADSVPTALPRLVHPDRTKRTNADPLRTWFNDSSARSIRRLADQVHSLSTSDPSAQHLGGFYFTALALTVRALLTGERVSNPTWFKMRRHNHDSYSPSPLTIRRVFDETVQSLKQKLHISPSRYPAGILIADSSRLPLPNHVVDAIVTSPPYCTRLDYPVATQPELSLLGFGRTSPRFRSLRNNTLGTPTIRPTSEAPTHSLGPSCDRVLSAVATHSSRASSTYYFRFLSEIGAVSPAYGFQWHRTKSSIVSDLHGSPRTLVCIWRGTAGSRKVRIDLAAIASEQLQALGWTQMQRTHFDVHRTLADLNPLSSDYRPGRGAVESVLEFQLFNSHLRNPHLIRCSRDFD